MEIQRTLHSMPVEIIVEIFSWCGKSDLLSLTLVCKSFNEIISNSKKLMRKVSIHFTNENVGKLEEEEWIGSREYSYINIHNIYLQTRIVMTHSRFFVTNLELKGLLTEIDCLARICVQLPNLKHLTLDSITLQTFHAPYRGPIIPFLKLDSLYVKGNKNVLQFLMNAQTKKLVTNSPRIMRDEIAYLGLFIKKQRMLKEYETNSLHVEYHIFNNGYLNTVAFRLEKLIIKNQSDFRIPNFIDFLEIHRKTLKYVELTNSANNNDFCEDVLNKINKFKNLKKLILTSVDPTFNPMPYVEELHFMRVRDYENLTWSDKFLNVKHLVMACADNEKFKEISNLKKLQSLKIFYATGFPTAMVPIRLRCIEINRKSIMEIKYFGNENEQLRELVGEVSSLSQYLYEQIMSMQRVALIGRCLRLGSEFNSWWQRYINRIISRNFMERLQPPI